MFYNYFITSMHNSPATAYHCGHITMASTATQLSHIYMWGYYVIVFEYIYIHVYDTQIYTLQIHTVLIQIFERSIFHKSAFCNQGSQDSEKNHLC